MTLLRRKVLEECEKEERIAAGAARRENISIRDAVPGEASEQDEYHEDLFQ